MRTCLCILGLGLALVLAPGPALSAPKAPAPAAPAASEASAECLGCHEAIHPGLVAAWKKSRHALTTPGQAVKVKDPGRKVSSKDIPGPLLADPVGCAECHTMRAERHAGTFEHNGYRVHTAVSPDDCAVCHAAERAQYSQNIMALAYGNLKDNPVYQSLVLGIDGVPSLGKSGPAAPDPDTEAESCLYCHGTRLVVSGKAARDTEFGDMDFPQVAGWPNQGVGRVNTDNSLGSCTACHTRHGFSMAEARKPYTCKECHDGPDVPAYKVYAASKHGNIQAAEGHDWDYSPAAWTVGRDFSAPTCAACHMSLLLDPEGQVVAERSHAVMDRLPWRIFGVIYAHPQPASPDTRIIKNADGLPLATALDGTPASEFLIRPEEMARRKGLMQAACRKCHADSWVEGHWRRLENTIRTTNASTLAATKVLLEAWSQGYALGLAESGNIFDEFIERTWCDIWLFSANSVRFSSAMAGGGDYGVFADGRYQITRRLALMRDWLAVRKALGPKAP